MSLITNQIIFFLAVPTARAFMAIAGSLILIYYIRFTLRFRKEFKRTVIFSAGIKRFHLIAIWLLPFFWIILLKAVTRPAPGSYEVEDKRDPEPWSSPYGGDAG